VHIQVNFALYGLLRREVSHRRPYNRAWPVLADRIAQKRRVTIIRPEERGAEVFVTSCCDLILHRTHASSRASSSPCLPTTACELGQLAAVAPLSNRLTSPEQVLARRRLLPLSKKPIVVDRSTTCWVAQHRVAARLNMSRRGKTPAPSQKEVFAAVSASALPSSAPPKREIRGSLHEL
jgi:hypothetical protein